MVIVDANVLLYARNADARQHATARTWLDGALSGAEGVGLPWVSLLAFLRIATNPRATAVPLTAEAATAQVERWLAAPSAITVAPTARHAAILAGLLQQAGTAGNLVTDAHLAALAIEHGATIVSFDRDFGRFAGLTHRVPE
ncbi:MAG TPA: type II toxin-antitoxin system VapC family toxin [Solirubrobacteraceae bacterium]